MTEVTTNGSARVAAVPAQVLAALELALEAAPAPHVAGALADADPLRLDLPPLPALRAASPESLRALGALYLAARMEDMGLLRAAEWLVRERAVLRVPPATAARLEELARRRQQDVAADQRALLYARLFGIGPGVAANPAGSDARFEPLLAALCSALVVCGARTATARGDRDHAAVADAGRELAVATGATFGGATALMVPRIENQLRSAIALLSDAGIGALVGAQGFWATLRALLGAGAPDLRRLLDIGRNGQQVLHWLAGAVGELAWPAGAAPAVPPSAVTSAAAWLQACGLALPARREGWA